MTKMKIQDAPYSVAIFLVLSLIGCGVKIGNPDKEEDETNKLSDNPETVLQLVSSQVDEVVLSGVLLDNILSIGKGQLTYFDEETAETSCLSEDELVTYAVSATIESEKKPSILKEFESTSVFSEHDSTITCDTSGSKLDFSKSADVEFLSEETFKHQLTTDEASGSTEGRRTTQFSSAIESNGTYVATKTVTLNITETKSWDNDSYFVQTVTEENAPLIFISKIDQNNKLRSRSIVSGTLSTVFNKESRVVVSYSDLVWGNDDSCLPDSGAFSGEIFDLPADQQTSLSFVGTASIDGIRVEFSDGTILNTMSSVCSKFENNKEKERL